MRTALRKVGNSRGIIIPAVMLEACELSGEVELRVEGKALIIEAPHVPRAGWFDGYVAEQDVAAELTEVPPVIDAEDEWEW